MWMIRGETTATAGAFWAEILEPLCLSVSFFEAEDPSFWVLEGLCDTAPNLTDFQAVLDASGTSTFSPPSLSVVPLPEINWVEENRRSFPPLEIGSFYIYGSHHENPPPPGKRPLKLDAATAFGSGHHGTTSGCLLLLEDLAQHHPWKRALDLGCGSGILALAMASLCPSASVWATDNDPEAIRVARENATINNKKKALRIQLSDGMEGVTHDAPFDLIVANILATPLIVFAEKIVQHLSPLGHVILSGFLVSQQQEVAQAYEARGWSVEHSLVRDGWASVCLGKKVLHH